MYGAIMLCEQCRHVEHRNNDGGVARNGRIGNILSRKSSNAKNIREGGGAAARRIEGVFSAHSRAVAAPWHISSI